MTDSRSPTLAERLRQTTDEKRQQILNEIETHLDNTDYKHYLQKIEADLWGSAQNGMDIGKSILDIRQEFNFVDEYWQSQHWNSRDAYRESFRDRLLPLIRDDLGFENINIEIREGVNQWNFRLVVEVSW